jgi:hypothetical protein
LRCQVEGSSARHGPHRRLPTLLTERQGSAMECAFVWIFSHQLVGEINTTCYYCADDVRE